jgi:hypothetical protein
VGHPRYVSGDRLWVKETFGYWPDNRRGVAYAADGVDREEIQDKKWRPLIFMPRGAARIKLEILRIRVERLQAITEDDAKAEGFPLPNPQPGRLRVTDIDGTTKTHRVQVYELEARAAFCHLWDGINGKAAPWSSNPFCWVIEFRRVIGGAS